VTSPTQNSKEHQNQSVEIILKLCDLMYEELDHNTFLDIIIRSSPPNIKSYSIKPHIDRIEIEKDLGIKTINNTIWINFVQEIIDNNKETLRKILSLVTSRRRHMLFSEEILMLTLKVLEKNRATINKEDMEFMKEQLDKYPNIKSGNSQDIVYTGDKKIIIEKLIKIFGKNELLLSEFFKTYFFDILSKNAAFQNDARSFMEKNHLDTKWFNELFQNNKTIEQLASTENPGQLFIFKLSNGLILDIHEDIRVKNKFPEQEIKPIGDKLIKIIGAYIQDNFNGQGYHKIIEEKFSSNFNYILVALNGEENIKKYKQLVDAINKNQDYLLEQIKTNTDIENFLSKMLLFCEVDNRVVVKNSLLEQKQKIKI